MNTPRENLIEQYSERFGGNAGFDVLRDMEKNMEQLLKPYAIGRWVSVKERLPEAQGTYRVRWSDDLEDIELNHSFFALGNPHSRQPSRRLSAFTLSRQGANITHWLDLSLPEVEG